MSRKNFRKRNESSTSESEEESVEIKERIEDLKFLQKMRVKSGGVDANALALGDASQTSSISKVISDPWKLKTGGLVDMKRINENNDVVNNMNNNFAKETNQRDEDAKMQEFIEEQLRLKKAAEAAMKQASAGGVSEQESSNEKKMKRPDDALFDVPKHLISNNSKNKSEETLSEQMLSGIPEVDLGVGERIRNIEETERAKQMILYGSMPAEKQKQIDDQRSENFVQHKRYDHNNHEHKHKHKKARNKEPLPPVVGDGAKHELLQKEDKKDKKELIRPNKDNPSDEYCLERFKKNMRHSRNSKIKVA